MKRIDHATATVDDEFTEGNPGTGTPATRITAQWLNVLQEEIAHLVEQAGMTLDQTGVDRHQVYAALASMFGATDFATDAEVLAATVNNKVVAPSSLAAYKSFGTSGYIRFPGGFTIQWGKLTGITFNESWQTIVFPLAFPTAVRGVNGCVGRTVVTSGTIAPLFKSDELTTTGMKIQGDPSAITSDTGDFFWFAFGH